jgi:hypothetical protein
LLDGSFIPRFQSRPPLAQEAALCYTLIGCSWANQE